MAVLVPFTWPSSFLELQRTATSGTPTYQVYPFCINGWTRILRGYPHVDVDDIARFVRDRREQ